MTQKQGQYQRKTPSRQPVQILFTTHLIDFHAASFYLSMLLKLSTFIAGCNIISFIKNLICTIYACIFIYTLIIKLKERPMENMGKNIKSYATTQVHFPGKGREALQQKVQILWLKYSMA